VRSAAPAELKQPEGRTASAAQLAGSVQRPQAQRLPGRRARSARWAVLPGQRQAQRPEGAPAKPASWPAVSPVQPQVARYDRAGRDFHRGLWRVGPRSAPRPEAAADSPLALPPAAERPVPRLKAAVCWVSRPKAAERPGLYCDPAHRARADGRVQRPEEEAAATRLGPQPEAAAEKPGSPRAAAVAVRALLRGPEAEAVQAVLPEAAGAKWVSRPGAEEERLALPPVGAEAAGSRPALADVRGAFALPLSSSGPRFLPARAPPAPATDWLRPLAWPEMRSNNPGR
jgi:hypothetical protein